MFIFSILDFNQIYYIMNLKHLMLLFLAVNLASCATRIPETDSTPPEITFKIEGDGFNRTFTDSENLENLQVNLNNTSRFRFTLTGSDQGGLQILGFTFPKDYVQITTELPEGWETISGTITDTFVWRGNSSSPTTGTILTGFFEVSGITSFTFDLSAEDFGGSARTSNRTAMRINCLAQSGATEVLSLE